eukprot:2241228-Prymnesium_polylepis.1
MSRGCANACVRACGWLCLWAVMAPSAVLIPPCYYFLPIGSNECRSLPQYTEPGRGPARPHYWREAAAGSARERERERERVREREERPLRAYGANLGAKPRETDAAVSQETLGSRI